MNTDDRNDLAAASLSRRGLLQAGAAAAALVAGGCATTTGAGAEVAGGDPTAGSGEPRIRRYRRLGRTGREVSDIGVGTGRLADSNVVRYAYDRGITYFDTAEMYGDGDSERKIGGAMRHLNREKIFLTTKLAITREETEQSILDRFAACRERLQTPYVDALYMHSVTDLALIDHKGFHAAVARLKAAGQLRHCGLSSHGPRGQEGDSMEQVLIKAANDGRFDLMLMVYNFLNREVGEKIIAACKANDVGVTLMKTSPARLKHEPYDPENPSAAHARLLQRLLGRGMSQEDALAMLQRMIRGRAEEQAPRQADVDDFVRTHRIESEERLRETAVLWAMQHPAVATACVSMPDFESIDRFLPLSGQTLRVADSRLLDRYRQTHSAEYCRHGCSDCASACPGDVPVSTIMRYAYYFEQQGRQKHAMKRYAALDRTAETCLGCHAPCVSACTHGLRVQAQLLSAHDRLHLGA